jgi:glycosyltransferase involved in cell wall biosynthesis/SAM-dependent methyltransferase
MIAATTGTVTDAPKRGAHSPTRRVLSVVHYPVFGGPHNLSLRLAAPLRAHGWETIVLLPDEPGNAADRLCAGGVEVVTMALHRLRDVPDPRIHLGYIASIVPEVRAIRRLIRERSIDVVQVAGLVNPQAAIAARSEHVPVVWQLLDTRAPWPVALASMAFVRSLADVVMSTGRSVAASHPGIRAVKDRLVIFFPPADVEVFRPCSQTRQAVRAEWGVSDDSPVVGCVANINPQKGTLDLVRAFTLVRTRIPNARLIFVGAEYPTHAAYSRLVREAVNAGGLVEGRDVIFLDARPDHERQLTGFDVFAFAPVPRGEGITTAVLEAMAAALPVITTAVAGLPEVVEDGRTGFLVPPNDTDAFAGVLARLLGDPALRQQMGQEARRVAEGRFSVDICADTHVRAYAQALARHGKAVPVSTLAVGRLEAEPTAVGRVVDGISVFVNDPGLVAHDELDHDHANQHKTAQTAHFDRPGEEAFEIDRPHGAPRLYRFLLAEKLRRAVGPIGPHLVGASALVVCGGSGMDAEFLAGAGAAVTTSDLSLGAATRAKARSERYGLEIRSIVADVEHLPFADESVDLVAVHDGLHHLDDPFAGLSEMARVARRWVVVTEPARASVTRLAIRFGLALETEEAGNRVARMEPSEVAGFLEARGYVVLRAERYAMYYPHHPGAVLSLLSRPIAFQIVRLGWRLANALLGRFGNKMVVVAERDQSAVADSDSSSAPSPIRSAT